MIQRHLQNQVAAALSDTPVVFLTGARQVGKSTLARALIAQGHEARYLTLDDLTVLEAASRDPQGFVDGLEGAVVLDEVQRVPQLFTAIKRAVDRDRRPGRFLLTGSADARHLPRASHDLVGRMELLTLWPFSQGELAGTREGFIDALFADGSLSLKYEPLPREELIERIVRGGYPEVQQRRSAERRRAWFRAYLDTMLQREVRELSAVEDVTRLPRLLGLLAAQTGSHLNTSELSRTAGIPQSTLKRDLALFETLFLTHRLPAWSGNLSKRLIKSGKLYLTDTGLTAHVLGLDRQHLAEHPDRLGPLLEAFVIGELVKQTGWSRTPVRLYHLRTYKGREVDVVIEDERGRCVGLEIKTAASLSGRVLRGMRRFAEIAGDRFHRGVVLYTGDEDVPLTANMHAVPIAALWQTGSNRST